MALEHAERWQAKLFLATEMPPSDALLRVLHDWVKHHRLAGTLIDVVDYGHVKDGPGVTLIGHEADYYVDAFDGRPGLTYFRKRGLSAPDATARARDAIGNVLDAASRLVAEPGLAGLAFRTDELLVRVQDRMNAPNDEESFVAARGALTPVVRVLYPGLTLTIDPFGTPRQGLGVRVRAPGAPDLATLLGRVRAA